jgi:hypothetical protein
MCETKTANTPMFYIEYYKKNTEKLQDISEEGYATLELCMAQIASENIQDEEIRQELLDQYEEDMKNFVLDLDTSDREPVNPLLSVWRYDKKPKLYIHDEKGFHEVTEHAIKNLNDLQATLEQIETVNYILNGTLDPEEFTSVQVWVSQCFNKPNSDELKMCAINQVLEGYGIEAVRTTKWKNGFWCDVLCTYINMGDSYIPTIIHHRKLGYMVASIGYVIEKNKHII